MHPGVVCCFHSLLLANRCWLKFPGNFPPSFCSKSFASTGCKFSYGNQVLLVIQETFTPYVYGEQKKNWPSFFPSLCRKQLNASSFGDSPSRQQFQTQRPIFGEFHLPCASAVSEARMCFHAICFPGFRERLNSSLHAHF